MINGNIIIRKLYTLFSQEAWSVNKNSGVEIPNTTAQIKKTNAVFLKNLPILTPLP